MRWWGPLWSGPMLPARSHLSCRGGSHSRQKSPLGRLKGTAQSLRHVACEKQGRSFPPRCFAQSVATTQSFESRSSWMRWGLTLPLRLPSPWSLGWALSEPCCKDGVPTLVNSGRKLRKHCILRASLQGPRHEFHRTKGTVFSMPKPQSGRVWKPIFAEDCFLLCCQPLVILFLCLYEVKSALVAQGVGPS